MDFNRQNIFYVATLTPEKFTALLKTIRKFLSEKPENDSVLIYA